MEMDIYMRRRLVALGGLVLFFILFVLLVKSCGGDDDPAPLNTTTAGATGEGGTAPLSTDEFISEADNICSQANSAVGAIDPTDPDAVREEYQITAGELEQLQALQVEDSDRILTQFFSALEDVVAALQEKQAAVRAGDTVAEDEAQLAIDTAEVEARELGDSYGFSDCGQFLDAGEAPGGAESEADATAPTDTGTGAATVPDPGATTPTAPAPTDDAGGAPPDDSGGISP
jgi:hypothetical protein